MKDEEDPDMRETLESLECLFSGELGQQLDTRLRGAHQSGLPRDPELVGVGGADVADGCEGEGHAVACGLWVGPIMLENAASLLPGTHPALGPCAGKGSDEQTLLRELLDSLQSGEILLGDAFYATYFLLCELVRGGVDGLFEQHGARKRSTDFRLGERLGARDHLIVLSKPKKLKHVVLAAVHGGARQAGA